MSEQDTPKRPRRGLTARFARQRADERRAAAEAAYQGLVSVAVTEGIRVEVEPEFLPHESDTIDRRFVWAYHVRLTNERSDTVQLVARHWVIVDDAGRQQQVKGPGVVGQTPVLRPGERFGYSSGCPLETAGGLMQGTYLFRRVEHGSDRPPAETFEVLVPPFALVSPESTALPH